MKMLARVTRMGTAWSGEIDEPVAQLRPFNWLIRSVRPCANNWASLAQRGATIARDPE
jgi:hypothetical protein